MSRTFLYARVSTTDQTTENQVQEIRAQGFDVAPYRVVTETVSGSVPTTKRKEFTNLMARMEPGDVLLVTKLDRLGRNAMDVRITVELLATRNIKVHCLALGGVDLTSPAGKMTMGVIAAVAEFERDLLIERTNAGLSRAKSQGKKLGRPAAASAEQIHTLKNKGLSQGAVASTIGVSLSTVKRLWKQSTQPTP
ncbi:recombinase family protein [Pseudomonas alloputida]|uniref:recombinase family protein n=1 Tax=Pseudomonas alloputida TaxID=1940621 RepID=UPI001E3E1301|nr:recombinase family protein [Pseudomonas alloputida]MCE1061454.1 recombinase family protein [Pseudomonas alloputida]